MGTFVNRSRELAELERWWHGHASAAVVWGRRRVGKTALVQRFAEGKRVIFHTGAGRGELGELALLSNQAAEAMPGGLRSPAERPYTDWDDALEDLAARAADRPALLVLDEFPELVESSPRLPGTLRAFIDRSAEHHKLRLLLCGSAVRYMQALQEEREPLYGRFDLALLLHPFAPDEAALMLDRLTPADRALVYGVLGGMPLYLSWWDQDATIEANLERLVCQPAARLLTEGDLVLRTEIEGGEYAHQVLHAVANGYTQYGAIKSYVRAEPARTLDRLMELRLVERVLPVGESARSKRRLYRIVDPFLSFQLGAAARYRTQIERGLGPTIVPVLREALDDHMGGVWEEAFRHHLRRRAVSGDLGVEGHIVAVGSWWDASTENEIDAVALAGRSGKPVLAGEANWAVRTDARRAVDNLRRKVERGLGIDPDGLRYVVCARTALENLPPGTLGLTAADLFGPPGD